MYLPVRRSRRFHAPGKMALVLGSTLMGAACTEKPLDSPISPIRVSHSAFTNAPTGTLAQKAEAQRTAANEGRSLRGIEEEILRIEQAIPGLGGFFMDSTGSIVVYSPPEQSEDSIRLILKDYASTLRVRPGIREKFASSNSVKVIPSRFPFSYLVVWQITFMQYVRPGSGIIGVDADEKYNTLTIVIDSTYPSAEQYVIEAAQSAEIPVEALRIEKTANAIRTNLTAGYRPTAGGLQIYISSSGTCSLGFNATTSTGLRGFITAGHCAPGLPGSGLIDTAIGQPNLNSGNRVGKIHSNPVWNRTDGSCGGYTRCTIGDVLFAVYDSAAITSAKSIALTASIGRNYALGSRTVTSSQAVSMVEYYPFTGDSVDKVGRTTGWTRGVIVNSCYNFAVTFIPPTDSSMTLCSIRVEKSAIGQGDSGGPVFYDIDSNLTAYGVVIGMTGNSVENDEGKYVCANSSCTYVFTPYLNIVSHLGFTPVPY